MQQSRYSSQADLAAIINVSLLSLFYPRHWGNYILISSPLLPPEGVGDVVWRHDWLHRSLLVGFKKAFILLLKEAK